MAHLLSLSTVAFFGPFKEPPPPPPPPPAFDTLSALLTLIAILGATLLILVLRRSRTTEGSSSSTAAAAAPRDAKKQFPHGPLVILWGSQTGTAEGFGNELAREARGRGWDAKSVDLEEYEAEDLADGAWLVHTRIRVVSLSALCLCSLSLPTRLTPPHTRPLRRVLRRDGAGGLPDGDARRGRADGQRARVLHVGERGGARRGGGAGECAAEAAPVRRLRAGQHTV
jgi:hypothetical protein